MSINERIKALRKQLGYNQEEFGKKIGLKKSAASWIEQDGHTVTDQNIRAICDTFNVSERWLRTGEGEMHVDSRRAYIKKLAQQYQVGAAHAGLIEAFLSLTDAQRDNLLDILRQMVAAADAAENRGTGNMSTIEKSSTVVPTNEDSSAVDREAARAAAHRQLDLELDAQEKGSSSTYANTEKRA